MSEASTKGAIDRARWRRALRHHLRSDAPALRVVAEGFLAEASEIDLLAVGARDEWIAIRIAEAGRDRETLTRTLSDLAWLRARSPGLVKLAPELGVDPHAAPRALLYADGLSSDTRRAIELLPTGWVSARRVIPLEQQGRLTPGPRPVGGCERPSPRDHGDSCNARRRRRSVAPPGRWRDGAAARRPRRGVPGSPPLPGRPDRASRSFPVPHRPDGRGPAASSRGRLGAAAPSGRSGGPAGGQLTGRATRPKRTPQGARHAGDDFRHH